MFPLFFEGRAPYVVSYVLYLRVIRIYSIALMQSFSNDTMLYTIDFDTELQSSNDYLLVPLVGVEPTNALRLYVLSVACLPFHHRGML